MFIKFSPPRGSNVLNLFLWMFLRLFLKKMLKLIVLNLLLKCQILNFKNWWPNLPRNKKIHTSSKKFAIFLRILRENDQVIAKIKKIIIVVLKICSNWVKFCGGELFCWFLQWRHNFDEDIKIRQKPSKIGNRRNF